jgi:hypothetical protein
MIDGIVPFGRDLMTKLGARTACALAVVGAMAAAMPAVSKAESSADDWSFSATIYAWLPSIDGNLSVPVETGGSSVGVDPSAILDALNFTFMGMFEADKGRWGVATDVIYLDLGSSKSKVEDFTVGGVELPATATAKASLDLSGWLWTLDGTYLAVDDPDHPVKLLAGARMLDLTTDLKWKLEGDITGVPLPGREGSGEASDTVWDAIVGVKGRVAFGDDKKWFVPYYLDVGTGDSDLTWQGMLGAGYAFDWGDLVAVWRYLDYNMPSGEAIEDLSFYGAAIGVTFHF